MIWCVLTYSIFSGLCCFSQAPWHLGVLRFLSALGMGGEWALGVALVMEVWPQKSRPLIAGLIGAAANVGFLLIGILALALSRPDLLRWLSGLLSGALPEAWFDMNRSSWRLLLLVGALPALLTCFIRIFVPESERWKRASIGAPAVRLREIFSGPAARLAILGACLAGIPLLGGWGSVQQAIPWAAKLAQAQGLNRAEATAWAQIHAAVGAVVGALLAAPVAEKLSPGQHLADRRHVAEEINHLDVELPTARKLDERAVLQEVVPRRLLQKHGQAPFEGHARPSKILVDPSFHDDPIETLIEELFRRVKDAESAEPRLPARALPGDRPGIGIVQAGQFELPGILGDAADEAVGVRVPHPQHPQAQGRGGLRRHSFFLRPPAGWFFDGRKFARSALRDACSATPARFVHSYGSFVSS